MPYRRIPLQKALVETIKQHFVDKDLAPPSSVSG